MSVNKKLLINTTNPSIEARDLEVIESKSGNLYQSITIIAKRANQINTRIKDELHRKLEEFGSLNDNLPAFVVLITKDKKGQPLMSHLWGSGFLPARHQGVRFR